MWKVVSVHSFSLFVRTFPSVNDFDKNRYSGSTLKSFQEGLGSVYIILRLNFWAPRNVPDRRHGSPADTWTMFTVNITFTWYCPFNKRGSGDRLLIATGIPLPNARNYNHGYRTITPVCGENGLNFVLNICFWWNSVISRWQMTTAAESTLNKYWTLF
jgi:hypothetical protein